MLSTRNLTTAAFLCLATVAFGFSAEPHKGWHTTFENAEFEARTLGKPLLVHFHADWCGPCRVMESAVLSTQRVQAKLGTDVVAVKVNSDHRKDLVARFGITLLPSDVFVSPVDGKPLNTKSGKSELNEYVAQLTKYAALFPGKHAKAVQNLQDDVMLAGGKASIRDTKQTRSDEAAIASGDAVALDGYSPIAITAERKWVKGSRTFTATWRGETFHLATADELVHFLAEPERYAPGLAGCDPTVLAVYDREVPGDIRYGAYYQDRLYLHYSNKNRNLFIKNPMRYLKEVETVNVAALDEADEVVVR